MSRILVIGGYGAFGARLSRRLAKGGHAMLVAGRDMSKAAAFCTAVPGCERVRADRSHGIGMVLAQHRPDLVIDAAGPFQASSYIVPEACIAMRIPYLDLADAREFVTGIGTLDRAARAADVAIISGASSVPALSGAVVRHLARGLDRIDSVDMLITTSNRASAGESVARAILSHVGRPIRLWDGERWLVGHGWQDMRRVEVRMAGMAPLRRRRVALADVPDLDLLPAMLPGKPAVTFRAGTELGVQMAALWLLSWPVRWGWIRSLTGAERLLMPLYRAMLRFGSDRSAMRVSLRAGDIERCWSLIAEDGDGPEIPTMAAELLAEEMLADRIAAGARDASMLLTLEQFAPLFARLAIRHETVQRGEPREHGLPAIAA